QVTAQDAQGNTASGFTGTVTVGLGANPVGGTLSGHTTVAASAGEATLADLSLDRAGTGYTLTAAGAGLSGAPSAAFKRTRGAAGTLVRGSRDRPRRRGDGAGRGGQCGDGVCGVGGSRPGDESERRHAGGDDDGAGGERGGELRQPEPQQGGQRLHPDGGGAVPTGAHGGDERPLRHHAGSRDAAGLHDA